MIPESGLRRPANSLMTKIPSSLLPSLSTSNVSQKGHADTETLPLAFITSNSNNNKNGAVPGAGSVKFPSNTGDIIKDNYEGEIDKEYIINLNKQSSILPTGTKRVSYTSDRDVVNVVIIPSTTRLILPILKTTTPTVENLSYMSPTTFRPPQKSAIAISRRPRPTKPNRRKQHQNQLTKLQNKSTTNIPNVAYNTRKTPLLIPQSRPNHGGISINTTPSSFFNGLVTGRPGSRPGLAPGPVRNPEMFDMTVSAEQSFGESYGAKDTNTQNQYSPGKKFTKIRLWTGVGK